MATSASYHGNFSDMDQPTLNTVADYMADARVQLQDIIPDFRYNEASMLTALNVALLEARRIKPELFVYNWEVGGQVQSFTEVDDTYVDIEPQFRLAILHGLIGHALERDQEDVQDTRATAFLALFTQGLVGKALGAVVGGSAPKGKGGG
jgi:hypothetical protein